MTSDSEICANLIPVEMNNDITFVIKDPVIGDLTIDNRNYCQHKYYTAQIIHSHPEGSQPYPSYEDILKVLKHGLEYSIIITMIGVWKIHYWGTALLKISASFKETLKQFLSNLDYSLRSQADYSLLLKHIDAFNLYLTQKGLLLKISFHSWPLSYIFFDM